VPLLYRILVALLPLVSDFCKFRLLRFVIRFAFENLLDFLFGVFDYSVGFFLF